MKDNPIFALIVGFLSGVFSVLILASVMANNVTQELVAEYLGAGFGAVIAVVGAMCVYEWQNRSETMRSIEALREIFSRVSREAEDVLSDETQNSYTVEKCRKKFRRLNWVCNTAIRGTAVIAPQIGKSDPELFSLILEFEFEIGGSMLDLDPDDVSHSAWLQLISRCKQISRRAKPICEYGRSINRGSRI